MGKIKYTLVVVLTAVLILIFLIAAILKSKILILTKYTKRNLMEVMFITKFLFLTENILSTCTLPKLIKEIMDHICECFL